MRECDSFRGFKYACQCVFRLYLRRSCLAFVSASCLWWRWCASSNRDTFACAVGVRVSLTHSIWLAPLGPVRATMGGRVVGFWFRHFSIGSFLKFKIWQIVCFDIQKLFVFWFVCASALYSRARIKF